MLRAYFLPMRTNVRVLSSPTAYLLGELVAVLKPIRFIFSNPPRIVMNFNVMPSSPTRTRNEQNGSLAEGRNVIEVVVDTHMLQKLYSPRSIVCILGPPGSLRKVMLRELRLGIGKICLFYGVVRSFDASNFGAVIQKPTRRSSACQYRRRKKDNIQTIGIVTQDEKRK